MTEETVQHEILQLEISRCTALTSGDLAALGALLAEDYVHVHGDGHLDGKTDYLSGVESKYKFHRIDRGELTVRSYGDVVVVIGPLSQAVSVNGVDKVNEVKAIATQIWMRDGDGWRQSTCHMGFLSVA